jgi:arabinan endo-1,5-alpha-L-arabinosidase
MKNQIKTALAFCIPVGLLFSCAPRHSAAGTAASIPDAPPYDGFRRIGDTNLMTDPALWGELNVHDPSIIKAGDFYYVFSTDASYGNMHKPGIQIRRSRDLITWQYAGTAFKDFETDAAEAIAYAKLDTLKKDGFWAPDIIKVRDTYRLYFSASTFGSSRSCIALAEAAAPEGPYRYRGIVVSSEANALNGPNAIDPALIRDTAGNIYLSYGSFFGGIFLTRLDERTGFLPDKAEKPVRIAGSRGAAVEGSCIVYLKESGYYYLFVSYGSLSKNYNIRVGRSRDIKGPYLDARGANLALVGAGNENDVGTKVMGGYTFIAGPGPLLTKGFKAPGHNSILVDGDDYFLVHHVRTYTLPDYWFSMNVRRFFLNRFGWPVAAPNRYTGEKTEAAALPDGEYALVAHLGDSNTQSHDSQRIRLQDGVITGSAASSYHIYDDYRIEILLDGSLYDGIVIKQYDWEREADVWAFTVMSEDGLAIWGCTQL